MAVCYILLGSICIALFMMFKNMDISANFLLILGIITYILCIIITFTGRYAEGKGKLINIGNKLIRCELKPAEFIKEYELKKNAEDLVVKQPSIEVLHLVITAYDLLDQRDKALETAEEMVAVADAKKKAFAKLLKASLLYSYDKFEEAEALFVDVQKDKLDIISKNLANVIFKTERAKALGDYKTVELCNLKLLESKFPKLDNLTKVVLNFQLGEIYEKMGENEKAFENYLFCANFGGETALKVTAKERLKNMQ